MDNAVMLEYIMQDLGTMNTSLFVSNSRTYLGN